MNLMKTARFGLVTLLVAGACAVNAPRALAQGGGGFQMPPAIKAKIEAWKKWGESHKNLTNLGDMVFQVGAINKEPATAMNKGQATKMLGIIRQWKTKTTMNEDEAKSVSKQIGGLLTEKQLKKMSTIETPSQRMKKGGFGGGGGRPGGGGGGGGARPGGNFTFPDPPAKGWNPFNPDSLPFEQARPRAKASMNEFVSSLEKLAK